MLTVRFSPTAGNHPFRPLFGTFGQTMGEEVVPAGPVLNGAAFPTLNAWQDDECFYVEAEIPGLALENLEITLPEPATLCIQGQRQPPAPEGSAWLRRERGYGQFERHFHLPGPVADEGVEATLRHGVLTVKLPKAPEIRPRKIAVHAV